MTGSVLTEYVYEKLMHKKVTVDDRSAEVTGLLLALNLPASAPWYLPVLGSVFAILFVKQLFGGLGQNFMNPALAARCFLLISFAWKSTDFTYDAVSGATPLAAMKAGESVNVLNLFLGKTAGTIGETSTLAILIGAVILLVFKVIDLRIPLSCLLSFSVFAILFGGHGFDLHFLAAQLCAGGLMLGTFFMAIGLCNLTDHQKRSDCVWMHHRYFHRGFPFPRKCIGGRILCDHPFKPSGAFD